jgi:WD40 repeat protein
VRFSPDGKILAVAGWKHAVTLLDIANGQVLATIRGHEDQVQAVAYSPDGKTLASSSRDRTVRLWDVASRKPLWRFQLGGERTDARSVAFSPDGRSVAAVDEHQTVFLLDARTGKMTRRLSLPKPVDPDDNTKWFRAAVFSPDGKVLATAIVDSSVTLAQALQEAFSPPPSNDSAVILWEVGSGKELRRFEGHGLGPTSVAFSPDGRILAFNDGGRIVRIWDLALNKEIAVLKEAHDPLAFAPDGSMLATKDGKAIKLWIWKERPPMVASGRTPVSRDRLEELLDALVKNRKNDQESVEALYLATLARFPTETETKVSQEFLFHKEDRRGALKELLFGLINTKEFIAHVESLEKRHSPRQH